MSALSLTPGHCLSASLFFTAHFYSGSHVNGASNYLFSSSSHRLPPPNPCSLLRVPEHRHTHTHTLSLSLSLSLSFSLSLSLSLFVCVSHFPRHVPLFLYLFHLHLFLVALFLINFHQISISNLFLILLISSGSISIFRHCLLFIITMNLFV